MKILSNIIRSFWLLLIATPLAWAVYPPSTAIVEPGNKNTANSDATASPGIVRLENVADRLEANEKALSTILIDLQKNEELLRKRLETSPQPAPSIHHVEKSKGEAKP